MSSSEFLADLVKDLEYLDMGHDTAYSKVLDADGNWIGIHEWHRCVNGVSAGGINFDTPEGRAALADRPNGVFWQVVTWTPLTLVPSIGCRECGHHGYITNGEWNPV